MLELMKRQITKGFVELHFLVPELRADEIKKVIACLGGVSTDDDAELIPLEKAFPAIHPGITLRGYRQRDGLSQVELAEKVGARQSHISEIESGRRPIGKQLAHKLAAVFHTSYKLFL